MVLWQTSLERIGRVEKGLRILWKSPWQGVMNCCLGAGYKSYGIVDNKKTTARDGRPPRVKYEDRPEIGRSKPIE